VVALARISPIDSISNYVPGIQDKLRTKGFPRKVEGELKSIRFAPLSPPEITSVKRFEFQNRERTLGLVVTKDTIALQASKYSTFEDFCGWFQIGLDAVHAEANVQLIEQIALRYVDLITPRSGEELEQYVHPGLLGLKPEVIGLEHVLRTYSYKGLVGSTTFSIRLMQRDDGVALPPDLDLGTTLEHRIGEIGSGEIITLLDFDHVLPMEKTPIDFSTHAVMTNLTKLHDKTDLAFRESVTPFALKVWGEGEIDAAK
jgi:uncharacterized protein (TIGR04255 family)